MKLMCKISGFLWEIISAKYMYLGQNYCKMFRAVYSIYFRVHTQIEPRIGCDVLFMFCPCLLCLVSKFKVFNILCLGDWKKSLEVHLELFLVYYMNDKQTWSLGDFHCQIKSKFWLIKKRLSSTDFCFMMKIEMTNHSLFKQNFA